MLKEFKAFVWLLASVKRPTRMKKHNGTFSTICRLVVLSFVASLSVNISWADQITLKNGDRLTGSLLKSDDKNLILKSEFTGTVTISWDAVAAISAPGPLYVGLKDGQTVVGSIATTDGKFSVTTQTAGVVTAAKESVLFIRSKDEQAAYEAEIDRYRNPRLVDLWTGTLDLGYAASQGNATTQSFTLAANANRATSRDKIGVYYTSLFASNDIAGKRTTSANFKRGGISYNLNVRKKMFVFGSTDLETDQFQSLDLRFVPAGGVGYHAIATEKTQLDLNLGAAANREFFSTGLNRTSAELLLGEDLVHKFTATTSIHEKLVFFPNLSSSGDYRINFDTTLVTAIRKWMSWQFTVSDRFLSNPVVGRKKNDVLFSTGVRLTFAK
jgi:putative salt-induced outer membrane protein YdiY